MIQALIAVVILALIFGFIWWIVNRIQLSEPFKGIALAGIALIFLLLLLGIFFGGVHLPVLKL